jgi:cytochrome P450
LTRSSPRPTPEDELLATAYLLILAGYETTVNLIGNGVLALLQNPSHLAALHAEPSRLPNAVGWGHPY